MSSEYLIVPQSDYRARPSFTDEELTHAEEARQIRVGQVKESLPQLTEGLDPLERIVFSAAYRISTRAESASDREFFESIEGVDVVGQLKAYELIESATGINPLVPSRLWTEIPQIDPYRKRRAQIEELRNQVQKVTIFEQPQEIVLSEMSIAA